MSHKNHYNKCDPVDLEQDALCHLIQMDYEFRSLDGCGNNLKNPEYGKTNKPFLRKVPALYNNNDGCTLNDLNGARPNPRDVSNAIHNQDSPSPNSRCLSNMFWLWGQFLDHTITITHTSNECVNIPVENKEDPLYSEIIFKRSESASEECGPDNPREQVNSLSPFIDASSVYGSDAVRNSYIREYCGGKLKMDCNGLGPLNNGAYENAGKERGPNYVCGDIRANEQLALVSLHTIFVREHNYWACKIEEFCPNMSDEEIYQRAKIMVEAEIQAISYNEFLPLLLEECLPCYKYDCEINPQLTNVFSAAAYRFAHSMVASNLMYDIELRDMYFVSSKLADGCIKVGEVLEQTSCILSEEMDAKMVDDLRNFLFNPPNQGGKDLAALDIQRGRDHGLGLLNDYLKACNLPEVCNFSDITSDKDLICKLKKLYKSVKDIDMWTYGLIRSQETSELLDPLFNAILRDGFIRIRNGDRLWYENRLSKTQTDLVNCTRLSDIIRRNTCCGEIPDNVFLVKPVCYPHWTKPKSKLCESCQPCNKCKPSGYCDTNYTKDNKCALCKCKPCKCILYKCTYCKYNPCKCVDYCKVCCSDPCKCKCVKCKRHVYKCICDLIKPDPCKKCRLYPCRCKPKCKCKPCSCKNIKHDCKKEEMVFKQKCDNSIFFKHSKYYEHVNKTGYKFCNDDDDEDDDHDCDCDCRYQDYYCNDNQTKHYHAYCDPCNRGV